MLNVNCTVTGNTFLCTSSVQCERWVFSMNWISTGSHRGAFSTFTLFLNVASKLKIYIYDASDAGLGVFLVKKCQWHI